LNNFRKKKEKKMSILDQLINEYITLHENNPRREEIRDKYSMLVLGDAFFSYRQVIDYYLPQYDKLLRVLNPYEYDEYTNIYLAILRNMIEENTKACFSSFYSAVQEARIIAIYKKQQEQYDLELAIAFTDANVYK